MPSLRTKIKEKSAVMREIYGGMMTVTDIAKELRMNREAARKWANEKGIGNQIGKRIKYETDEVARCIVETRGMC